MRQYAQRFSALGAKIFSVVIKKHRKNLRDFSVVRQTYTDSLQKKSKTTKPQIARE